ncbi:MAG: alpha-(1-_3)-arabinofuranosyltransferase [Actinobacteria bacterium]|nr:alpha-(1->3)-arabinofuranosyltransferase [Actinomycetota bacterium]
MTAGQARSDDSSRPTVASTSFVWKLRLVAAWLLLAGVAFRQAGGLTVPDTKLDLTADPGAFMARALHLWDPNGAMGQLQNQAYGYLFPVGPIHWLMVEAGLPPWVVQRLWWTIVLGVAFSGMWLLSGALRMGDRWARYVVALLFALSPRLLGEVAITSVEVWPLAMAPWVLLPLVTRRQWSWVSRITVSALAVAAVGGINAVATGATLVLPALWFLTRSDWRRAIPIALAWLGCVLLAISWWLGPLLILGRYSPAFLDWIENASITTAFASVFNTVVGTTPWLNFLSGSGGPSWPAGWSMVTTPALLLTGMIVPILGLVGIATAPRRHRVFLVSGLLVGITLTMLGHLGPVNAVGADAVNNLLDTSASALRNTHKFELVVRVPLALGAARAFTWIRHVVIRNQVWMPLRRVMVAALVLMISAPANGLLAKPEGYVAIPAFWRQAAQWLDANATQGTTMSVPATSFADFVWGSTKDDPLQALGNGRFVTRDAVPLGTAGTTRWLDELERLMGTGQGGETLAAGLRLGGVQHVLVRNDLRSDVIDGPSGRLARVHAALLSAGLVKVAGFGPPLGAAPGRPADSENVTVDQRTRLPYQLLEVYALPSEGAKPRLVDGEGLVAMSGGAEDVPHVLAAVGSGRAAVVGSDVAELPDDLREAALQVTTDGNQRREVAFGRPVNNRSAVLSAGDGGRGANATMDYVADPGADQTTRIYGGDLSAISASSSASDVDASWLFGSAYDPTAVIDGDANTAWVSGRFATGVGEWLDMNFIAPVDVPQLNLSLARNDTVALPTEVEVRTDNGTIRSALKASYGPQTVSVRPGKTKRLLITVTAVDDSGRRGAAFSEVSIPGVDLRTSLRLPRASSPPDVVSLRGQIPRGDCIWVVDRPLCVPGTGRQAEEGPTLQREVSLPSQITGPMRGTVVVTTNGGADRLLDDLFPLQVTASSRASNETSARPGTVVDGSLGTGWIASGTDLHPTLQIRLPQPADVGSIQFFRDGYLAASKPDRVTVTFDDGTSEAGRVNSNGEMSWPKRTTSLLTVEFGKPTELLSFETATSLGRALPVGVSEIQIPGVTAPRPLPLSFPTEVPCGFGPDLVINGTRHPTAVSGTIGDLLRGDEMVWTTCGDSLVQLPSGRSTISARATGEFRPVSASFGRLQADPPPPSVVSNVKPVGVGYDMAVKAADRSRMMIFPMNHNSGWEALDGNGVALQPIRAYGWQQAFIVPPGLEGTIKIRYGPDTTYRWALVGGSVLLLSLVALAFASLRMRHRWRAAEATDSLAGNRILGSVLVLAALSVLGGSAGAVVGAGSLLACFLLRRPWLRLALIAVCAAGAAGLVAINPWPAANPGVHDGKVQFLVLAAVAMAVVPAGWKQAPVRWKRVRSKTVSSTVRK